MGDTVKSFDVSLIAEKKSLWESATLTPPVELKPEYTLRNFQNYCIKRALSAKVGNTPLNFILSSSTGSGKTLMAYTCYFLWRKIFPNTRCFITTLASVAGQFSKEIDKFFNHNLNVVCLSAADCTLPHWNGRGYREFRKEAYRRFALPDSDPLHIDMLIENYHILRIDKSQLIDSIKRLKAQGIYVFSIFDELHYASNTKTAANKAVSEVRTLSVKSLGLTATLSSGSLLQVYGIFASLGIKLAPTEWKFKNFYFDMRLHKYMNFLQVKGFKHIPELAQAIQKVCVVLNKPDILEFLPPFTIIKREIPHNYRQIKTIVDIMSGGIQLPYTRKIWDEELEQEIETDYLDTALPIQQIGHIKRALQDPILVTKDFNMSTQPKYSEIIKNKEFIDFIKNTDNEKLLDLLDILENTDPGDKIAIYTPSAIYTVMLRAFLEFHPKVPECFRKAGMIAGGVSYEDRQQAVTDLENDKSRIIILTDAGTTGINLPMCNTMVITSLPKSAGDLVQLVGRISRLNSKSSKLLLYYQLHENSTDMDEYEALMRQLKVLEILNNGVVERGLMDEDVEAQIKKEQKTKQQLVEENKPIQTVLLAHRDKRIGLYKKMLKDVE